MAAASALPVSVWVTTTQWCGNSKVAQNTRFGNHSYLVVQVGSRRKRESALAYRSKDALPKFIADGRGSRTPRSRPFINTRPTFFRSSSRNCAGVCTDFPYGDFDVDWVRPRFSAPSWPNKICRSQKVIGATGRFSASLKPNRWILDNPASRLTPPKIRLDPPTAPSY